MKKILVFIDWFLPGYKAGGPVRSLINMIEQLHNDFIFYVVTSDRDYQETQPYEMEADIWHEHISNCHVMYVSPQNIRISNFRNVIRTLRPDFVHINGIYSRGFSILPLLANYWSRHKQHVVVSPRGMLSEHALDQKSIRKKTFLFLARMSGLYRGVRFHATAADEYAACSKWIRKYESIILAENMPRLLNVSAKNRLTPEKNSGTLKLLFLGRISPEKNLKFALEMLLKMDASTQTEFSIYGAIGNNEYWEECKQVMSQLPVNVKATYKGVLHTEKVVEIIKLYHFLFLPSTGENFGHSIAECLMQGCPVIISNNTPWTNLFPAGVGWDLPLENPQLFEYALLSAAQMEQAQYTEMSVHAINYITQKLNIEEIKHKYYLLYS